MDTLTPTFHALADPTRRAILARLAHGEATVNELAEPFALRLPTVSKHLKVLQRAGLISQGRRAQWRPCRLESARLRDVAEWIERFRDNWEESFQRLDEYLIELQTPNPRRIAMPTPPRPVTGKSAAGGAAVLTMPSDTEIVIIREFKAPRALVFEAMTRPEHIERWWGLRSTNMLECDIDFRIGGKWRFVLGSADGTRQDAFSGEYREIEVPERVVFTERYEPIPGSDHVITSTLTEDDGRTTLRVHIQYASVEHRDGHLMSGMEAGVQETYDRLEELLVELMAAGA